MNILSQPVDFSQTARKATFLNMPAAGRKLGFNKIFETVTFYNAKICACQGFSSMYRPKT